MNEQGGLLEDEEEEEEEEEGERTDRYQASTVMSRNTRIPSKEVNVDLHRFYVLFFSRKCLPR